MIRATLRCAAAALLLGPAALVFWGPARAQQGEAATIVRPAQLRDAPGETGRSVAALAAQEPVTRLGERQGGWIRVQTGSGASGWVHLFDLGPGGSNAASASSNSSTPAGSNAVTGSLRGLTNLLRGGSSPPPRTATSTIGIRGLEAEDLARAQPNLNAVGQMERLREGESGARQFAAEAALVSAAVPALPAPPRVSTPPGGNRQQP